MADMSAQNNIKLLAVEQRVTNVEGQVRLMRTQLQANTDITFKTSRDVTRLLEFFANAKTALLLIKIIVNWIVKFVKWIVPFIVACIFLWGVIDAIRHGKSLTTISLPAVSKELKSPLPLDGDM